MWRRLTRGVRLRTAPERAPINPKSPPFDPRVAIGGLANFRVAKQRSGMPVAIGNFFPHRGQLLDQGMVRREMADRIGGARVARNQEGLATAAAEILLAAGAALARLLHPVGAAERYERGRGSPDVGQRVLAHGPELEPGYDLGGVAWQHAACRRDIERAATPSADAGLGEARVIVRHHRVDDDAAMVFRAQHFDLAP